MRVCARLSFSLTYPQRYIQIAQFKRCTAQRQITHAYTYTRIPICGTRTHTDTHAENLVYASANVTYSLFDILQFQLMLHKVIETPTHSAEHKRAEERVIINTRREVLAQARAPASINTIHSSSLCTKHRQVFPVWSDVFLLATIVMYTLECKKIHEDAFSTNQPVLRVKLRI